jgi:hypothetical protein
LLALKGILMLSSATTTIANLAKAVGLIQAETALGGAGAVAGAGIGVVLAGVSALALSQLAALYAVQTAESGINQQLAKQGKKVSLASATFGARGEVMAIPTNNGGDFLGLNPNSPTAQRYNATHITVNVHSADPKAVVDAIGKYGKQNGNVPKTFTNTQGRR